MSGTLLVRERPPLRLGALLQAPDGGVSRWGYDERRPQSTLTGLSFSTVMPGGFENCALTLQRDPRRSFEDLDQFTRLTLTGAGGRVAHQSRIETLPDVSGDQAQLTPGAVGFQAHLDDRSDAREVYIDASFTNWQGPSIARQIEWLTQPHPVVASAPAGAPDFAAGIAALETSLQGAWAQAQVVEGWYDGQGIPLGLIFAAWQDNGKIDFSPAMQFGGGVFLCTDDTGVSYDKFGNISFSPGSARLAATQARYWGLVQFYNDLEPGGQDGVTYALYWTLLCVLGTHNLPLQGEITPTSGPGLLASDIIADAVSRWAPELYVSTATDAGAAATVQPSAFVIPQMVFFAPTKASDIIKQAARFELLDWAVWEHPQGGLAVPAFYCNPRGQRGRRWRVRSGPAKLQQAGSQSARMWNGVIVQWDDVSGKQRTVGPPGSSAMFSDSALADTNLDEEVNEAGLKRWALLTMQTATLAGATQVGAIFLAEQRKLDTSGQAAITGHIADEAGNWHPAWAIRAGDQIAFTDAKDPSYRRIVSTNYEESSATNTLQLDQPPDGLQALLERLSVVLAPTGFA